MAVGYGGFKIISPSGLGDANSLGEDKAAARNGDDTAATEEEEAAVRKRDEEAVMEEDKAAVRKRVEEATVEEDRSGMRKWDEEVAAEDGVRRQQGRGTRSRRGIVHLSLRIARC